MQFKFNKYLQLKYNTLGNNKLPYMHNFNNASPNITKHWCPDYKVDMVFYGILMKLIPPAPPPPPQVQVGSCS